MTRTALAVALATALCCTDATAAVSGHCTYEGTRHALVDGIAWIEADELVAHDWDEDGVPDEPEPPDITLGFGSFTIDAGAVQRAEDRGDALRDQAFANDEATKVELTLSPEGLVTSQYLWISPGTNLSNSGSDVGKYTAKAGAKGHLAGHYTFADDDAEGPACDITFDIAQIGTVAEAPPPPPLPGTPLPAGGGEPGKVYLALNRAVIAGDIDAIIKLLSPAKAAELQKARAQPELAQQMEFMQAMTAKNVKIVGGRIDGDLAWLEFEAEEGGAPRSGTVEMKREDGIWRVLTESTRDRD